MGIFRPLYGDIACVDVDLLVPLNGGDMLGLHVAIAITVFLTF